MPLLLDTGVIYAVADTDDSWHLRARGFLRGNRDLLMTPITVVPEVAYLLRTRLGAKAEWRFVESLAKGEIAVEGLSIADMKRAARLMQQYPQIGFVDASVVAVAERLRLDTIATTDRRHFSQIRPQHLEAFRMVP